ncbi:glycosyltransferase family 8 protein [Gorillibacterium timonense]|uniref:glycosyltransferase family 8 protein n=1 Tax=Gorillibacterium timonense TaxID=1689269 RepID=UPI00071D38E7|nr:glycosyltransferase family 8 protein [Gorillibacterium timonense]
MSVSILVTLNSNYIRPLKVMLKSLFVQHPAATFDIYLLHSSILPEEIADLEQYTSMEGHRLIAVTVDETYFSDAPVVKHYSKEMYYRILAFRFLPPELDKILYLDPDLMIINDILPLYETDLEDFLFAAAFHDRIPLTEINRLRLKTQELPAYYNSGVLLMNLRLQRETVREKDIFDYVQDNKKWLILPDQDVLNALYSTSIKNIEELRYNYDARFYRYYKLASGGKVDMDYVVRNTSIIHFCGKRKPWNKHYSGSFHSLYKHYEKLAFPSLMR